MLLSKTAHICLHDVLVLAFEVGDEGNTLVGSFEM